MVKYAKLAGMASGLVIGLGAGVLLAVMNPLIPNEDATQVAPAPTGTVSGGLQQDSAPTIGVGNDGVSVSPSSRAQPSAMGADATPDAVQQGGGKVRVGAASGLATPAKNIEGSGDLAIPKPDGNGNSIPAAGLGQPQSADMAAQKPVLQQSTKVRVGAVDQMRDPDMANTAVNAPALPAQAGSHAPTAQVASLPAINAPTGPDVSTTTATPLVIAEPKIDSATQGAEPAMPLSEEASNVLTPDTAQQGGASIAPKRVERAPDVVAALPQIPKSKRKVNKSGTFDTQSSRFATNGTAGFSKRNTSNNPAKFPKIGAQVKQGLSSDQADIGALKRNAVAFAGADKPLMSIVLIDIGDAGLPRKTLKNLTIPAAFALPADQAGVGELAQEFAQAGFEVLALSPRSVEMSLSGGLDQAQVDVVAGNIFSVLPQAIGLIDRTSGDLQKDRRLASSVVKSFAKTGHGLVTYAEGLNPVPRAAQEAHVAAGTVYRILDGKGESSAVMTRYLDRAVLDARRNGQVIVLGTTKAQTVATIVNWTLSSKARGVALAPVSASLLVGLE